MTPRAYVSMEKVVKAIEVDGAMTCFQLEKIVKLSSSATYNACMKGVSHGFLKRTFLARELRKGRKLVLFSRTQKKYEVPEEKPKVKPKVLRIERHEIDCALFGRVRMK